MEKNHNNPGILKLIQYCPRRKNKEEYCKRSKIRNMNVTPNTSNINTDITKADIAEFHTYQTDDNRISAQVQMSCMGIKIGVNAVTTNNDVSVTG